MLDQCHNIEAKIPAIIRSVMNVQEATAKALLVDGDALSAAQRAGDVLEANAVLMDAYHTDVRPLLREVREEMGLDPDPLAAYRRSGWAEKIVAERVGGQQAGWGRERLPGSVRSGCGPSVAGRAHAAEPHIASAPCPSGHVPTLSQTGTENSWHPTPKPPLCSPGRTGSAPIPATPTTPVATRRRKAPRPIRDRRRRRAHVGEGIRW